MEEMQKNNFYKVATICIVVLAVFIGVKTIEAIKTYSYIGRGTPAVNVITVSGKGEVLAKPDIAQFTFSVMEEGATAKEAQDKATTKSNAALNAVKAVGVLDKDIKTLDYNLSPKYEYQTVACKMGYACPPGKSVIAGYTVTQTIEVKVRKIDDASPLLTKITAAGASNISGISFVIDNEDSIQADAKGKAIADAKAKADVLAKQLGVSLGRIVNFSDDQGQVYYAKAYAMDSVSVMGASAPAPQLPTGDNKISSNVTITYEIK